VSSDKPSSRLLIIEQDARLVVTLREHFEAESYRVDTVLTGQEGLALAQALRPNLILLAARMTDMAGLDIFRALRDQSRTGHIPVMMLAGAEEAVLQNKILEEGAYDFIEKPLDLDILTLRVRNALRRAEREGLTEPRTGLPTSRALEDRVRALDHERGWRKIELKIDSFNVFRDRYGFVTANEALRHAGTLIEHLVNEHGSPDDFVGHVGGTETFVIITTQARGARLAEALQQRVTPELESFYNFMERDQGDEVIEDGAGGQSQRPLMSVQLLITEGEPDPDAPPAPAGDADDPWEDAVEDEKENKPDDAPSGPTFEW
jgi:DNA-binding response OmpR family regulator